MPVMATTVAGIDGYSGGWVVATVHIHDGQADAAVSRVTTLDRLIEDLDAGQLNAAGIDIPIGLPDSGPREFKSPQPDVKCAGQSPR
jgi:predicted RNase H-like nuclease